MFFFLEDKSGKDWEGNQKHTANIPKFQVSQMIGWAFLLVCRKYLISSG